MSFSVTPMDAVRLETNSQLFAPAYDPQCQLVRLVGLDRAPAHRELLSLQIGREFARLAQYNARRA